MPSGGGNYYVKSESHIWRESDGFKCQFNFFLHPDFPVEKTCTLKAGTELKTYASQHLRNQYANVFFMGQNGGFKDAGDLIKQLKSMITYSQSNRYIVISFHTTNAPIPTISRMMEMEDSLGHAFGKHFINLRGYLVKSGIKDAGLTATREDEDSISRGQVPPQLMIDGCHFTSDGYRLIAQLVYNKMKKLGYTP